MLDENLPTFFLKASSDKPHQNSSFLYTQYGSEPEPTYSLRHPDPSQSSAKNRYAAALYDAYNPDVLFAEVLLIPEWTQPNLSAEAIRLNGGVPPPPEPILPTEYTIQLYNPDQQVVVRQKTGSLMSAPSWEFEIPQQTFRQPSSSTIDKTLDDPAASEYTPKIKFKWKKDSKFSKDLACFLAGKTTNSDGSKKKNKEPDITVAIFKHLREVTLYEPNLQRVEMEDLKGFEVVLLLGAVVLRDVYFTPLREAFNVSEPAKAIGEGTLAGRKTSPPAAIAGLYRPNKQSNQSQNSNSRAQGVNKPQIPSRDPRVPPTDPRTQWEIDAEAARLKQQAEIEKRERQRKEEAEQKWIKKMLDTEEKEARRKQAQIDKETERLKRMYGKEDQQARPALPPRSNGAHRHSTPALYTRPQTVPQSFSYNGYPPQPSWRPEAGPYLNVPGGPAHRASSGFFPGPPTGQPKLKEKRSIFGFRRASDEPQRLQKKQSSLF